MKLRASNDNHIYINEKLNKALKKYIDQKHKGEKKGGKREAKQGPGTTGGSEVAAQ